MLQSNVAAINTAVALVMGVHACANFRASQSLIRDIFETSNLHGRVWLLLAFTVLLPDTPREWIPLLEGFTTELFDGSAIPSPGDFPLLRKLDLLPVALGLAYAKAGEPMRLFVNIIHKAHTLGDQSRLACCLNGLGATGIYYPQPVLSVFRDSLELRNSNIWELLLGPLSMIRTLHLDEVDHFLSQARKDDTYKRRVAARSDMGLLDRYIHMLGFFNNAVHFSIHYPKMRRALSMGAFELLAESKSATEFVGSYARAAFHLYRASGFRLTEWTLPE
jgi:hypothetical protein